MALTIEDKKFLMSEAVRIYSHAHAARNISSEEFVLDTYSKLCAAVCEGSSDTVEPKCFKGIEGHMQWTDLVVGKHPDSSEASGADLRDLLREFLAMEDVVGVTGAHKWFAGYHTLCDETRKMMEESV
jgi:hypothetical protein